MENYGQGDLTDIVRAGSRTTTTTTSSSSSTTFGCKKEDQTALNISFSSELMGITNNFSSDYIHHHDHDGDHQYSFGDPFCAAAADMRDPFFQHLDISSSSSSNLFNGTAGRGVGNNLLLDHKSGHFGVNNNNNNNISQQQQQQQQLVIEHDEDQDDDDDEVIKLRPCNIFSRMLQISPPPTNSSNKLFQNSPNLLLIPNNSNNSSSNPLLNIIHPSLHHFVDNNNPASTLTQISPPTIPPGIKRRKSQARKVVCVPAPVAAASSRPNGEVIPSDLWAWRKYGQKPIKGSPYPRGYYRCSSSKGCSARKQVERSRTDPNMLVITYTSEHNHPWPTQRNALAGSSRSSSQQSKNNTTTTTTTTSKLVLSHPSHQNPTPPTHHPDQEAAESDINNNNGTKSSTTSSDINNNNNNVVKEEGVEDIDHQTRVETTDHQEEGSGSDQFSEGFIMAMQLGSQNIINNHNHSQSDDFFADLDELHTDPLNLLFTKVQKLDQTKGSDQGLNDVVAFNNLFHWANNNNNNSNNSFEEPPPSATNRGFY